MDLGNRICFLLGFLKIIHLSHFCEHLDRFIGEFGFYKSEIWVLAVTNKLLKNQDFNFSKWSTPRSLNIDPTALTIILLNKQLHWQKYTYFHTLKSLLMDLSIFENSVIVFINL